MIIHLGSPVVMSDFVDGGFVAVTEDGHVRRWDSEGEDPVRLGEEADLQVELPAGSGLVTQAFTAADNRFIVVHTDAGTVSAVDLDSGDFSTPDVELDTLSFVGAARSGTRDKVLVWDYSGHGGVWDLAAGTVTHSKAFDEPAVSADISSDGEDLAVLRYNAEYDFTVQVYDTDSEALLDEVPLESHTDQALSYGWVRFTTTDGPQLAIVGAGWHSETLPLGRRERRSHPGGRRRGRHVAPGLRRRRRVRREPERGEGLQRLLRRRR